jgi:hypothetical protein
MASQGTISFQVAVAAQFCANHQAKPLVATYEVKNVTGASYLYLCNAVPLASCLHKGDGWTRVTVPIAAEEALLDHLKNFFEYAYKKLS